jgi:hypothetical protein
MPTETRCQSRSLAILISRWFAAFACVALFALSAYAADRTESAAPATVAGAPSFVRLDPIFVPVIVGNQVARQVGVTLMLQLVAADAKGDVETKRKQLYDALFSDLYGYLQDRTASNNRIDQTYLKARLLKTTTRIVGPNLVTEVLIEQFFERPK